MTRTRSLDDSELEALFPMDMSDGSSLRAQAAISLIVDLGLNPEDVRSLKMYRALSIAGDAAAHPRSRQLISDLLAAAPDRVFTLSFEQDEEMTADALLQLCRRHGTRAGVAGVSPERLRLTWARRAAESGVSRSQMAEQLGVSELRVRRMLAADRRARREDLQLA
jgi:integrase